MTDLTLKSYPGTRQPSKIGDPVNEEMHAPKMWPPVVSITVERDIADPAPAINAMVPIKIETTYAGKRLTFVAENAISAWADDKDARAIGRALVAGMLENITAESPSR